MLPILVHFNNADLPAISEQAPRSIGMTDLGYTYETQVMLKGALRIVRLGLLESQLADLDDSFMSLRWQVYNPHDLTLIEASLKNQVSAITELFAPVMGVQGIMELQNLELASLQHGKQDIEVSFFAYMGFVRVKVALDYDRALDLVKQLEAAQWFVSIPDKIMLYQFADYAPYGAQWWFNGESVVNVWKQEGVKTTVQTETQSIEGLAGTSYLYSTKTASNASYYLSDVHKAEAARIRRALDEKVEENKVLRESIKEQVEALRLELLANPVLQAEDELQAQWNDAYENLREAWLYTWQQDSSQAKTTEDGVAQVSEKRVLEIVAMNVVTEWAKVNAPDALIVDTKKISDLVLKSNYALPVGAKINVQYIGKIFTDKLTKQY